ncbi:preprotein translocase subunit SecE [Candidatus Nitrosacidococcus tergens]|uniref:Protein translocase subunit SecE n=1 Tax=Candidatus Nitrosacidococcus tergens TaxID=553981 RepID=A0A7G1Q8M1_9GAMM|nr:preprotein translocase subunit SecE [Candidatus Nitrosacidococcus tergens]CAB1274780.1 Protein translocase subunit SecE [Candidatus Nitrosacidococcus tergens]
MTDTAKFIFAFLLLTLTIGMFYYFSNQPISLRIVILLIGFIASLVAVVNTDRGQSVVGIMRDTQIEFRKIVWPGRQETTQTTLIVLLMVITVASILWLFDSLLMWAVRLLTGQGA